MRRLAGPRRDRVWPADQLANAQWPDSHRILVCSLAGGVGRTTLVGLIAGTLASALPAQQHAMRRLVVGEVEPDTVTTIRRRWKGISPLVDLQDRAGVPSETSGLAVLDVSAGLAPCLRAVTASPSAAVVLVVRPDQHSLNDLASALAWLHSTGELPRSRTVVVINDQLGSSDRRSRATATALGIRTTTVRRLPADRSLGPLGSLPPHGQLRPSLRLILTQLCLDIHRVTIPR